MLFKNIGILGSTGSIGKSTIRVINNNQNTLKAKFIVAKNDYQTLIAQAMELKPEFVVIANQKHYLTVKKSLSGTNIKILAGDNEVINIARTPCDIVVSSIVGAAGLKPTYAAIESGNDIALANKEIMVCAGSIINNLARTQQCRIIPIDSEHSAIMQIIKNDDLADIKKIILTASGGPFINHNMAELTNVTPQEALKHPTWQMGTKISIDSATMFNKAFELIEAHHLFNIDFDKLGVIIHPQSIIHAIVNYKNGTTMAHMCQNDMYIPIEIALFWPHLTNSLAKPIDFTQTLSFNAVDKNKYKALDLVINAVKYNDNMGIIINAANEVAVDKFINKQINFLDITDIVSKMVDKIAIQTINNIEDILQFDQYVREVTADYIAKNKF